MNHSDIAEHNLAWLRSPMPPVMYDYYGGIEELESGLKAGNIACHVVDCTGVANESKIFSAFSSALSFPDYFGENWPALWDMLTDLSWLPDNDRVVVLKNAPSLKQMDAEASSLLFSYLRDSALYWAIPSQDDPRYGDHKSVSLKFVLQYNEEDAEFTDQVQKIVGALYHGNL